MSDQPIDIRQLYDGLWDAESWRAGLDAVCVDLKAHHLISLVHQADGSGPDRRICWAVHVSDQQVDTLLHHAAEISALIRAAPMRRALPVEAVVPQRALIQTEVYRSAIRPMGGHHGVFALPFDQGLLVACRPPVAPHFIDVEIRRLQALVPHFETVLRLKRRLLAMETHTNAVEEGLDQLNVGVLIASCSGRVLYANRPAETIMREIHGQSGNARQIRDIIAKADGHHRMISRGPTRRPIVSRAVRISGSGSEHLPVPPQESVVIFLRDPEQKARAIAAELVEGLGLTPREASLAELLAADMTLADAADRLNISLGNARVHLKRIFSKTNTHRQAELVKLILELQL